MSDFIRPKVSREFRADRCAPDCPHCDASMERATVTLGEIALEGIPERVPVFKGYAASHQGPRVLCQECKRVSVLAIDAMSIKLIAARTEADERLLEGGA